MGSAEDFSVGIESEVKWLEPSQPEECTICCDILAQGSVSVLTMGQRRVCRHFFHTKCVESLRHFGYNSCPICRVAFNGSIKVPDIFADPRRWFKFVDVEKRGTITLQQILEVFRASLLVDYKQLEALLPAVYPQMDKDKDGRLSYKEVMIPRTGLLAYAKRFRPRQIDYSDMPDINRDKRAWFFYWDEDRNGQLSQEEVIRALTKTFNKSKRFPRSDLVSLRNIVSALWTEFDSDGSGEIDIEEFSRTNGLYDTVVVNLGFSRNIKIVN